VVLAVDGAAAACVVSLLEAIGDAAVLGPPPDGLLVTLVELQAASSTIDAAAVPRLQAGFCISFRPSNRRSANNTSAPAKGAQRCIPRSALLTASRYDATKLGDATTDAGRRAQSAKGP
jgi:hypothetical protein